MSKIVGSLVTYNNEWSDLKTAITSFLQSAPQADVYIWDNSTENHLENLLADEFGSKVNYQHSKTNYGYGAGHNRNFHRSQSTFFCILNPDVQVQKDTIGTLLEFLKEKPKYGLATCLIQNLDGTSQNVHKPMLTFKTYMGRAIAKLFKISSAKDDQSALSARSNCSFLPMLSGCFLFFKSEHYQALKGFDERFFLYFEDYDLTLRSFLEEKSIILHSTHIVHKWQRASHNNRKLFWIHLNSGLKFFNKWGFSDRLCKEVNHKALKLNGQAY